MKTQSNAHFLECPRWVRSCRTAALPDTSEVGGKAVVIRRKAEIGTGDVWSWGHLGRAADLAGTAGYSQIRKVTDGATIVRLVFSGTAAFLPIYQMD
jgi:hypothetical protein